MYLANFIFYNHWLGATLFSKLVNMLELCCSKLVEQECLRAVCSRPPLAAADQNTNAKVKV